MVIGATWEQVPLIRKAKEMGLEVLATDPRADAEGLALADSTATLDPRDLPRALDLAKRYAPDGVVADECDYSHYAAVFLSEHMGLTNDGLVAAQLTTNKQWMREACREAHIMQPRFFACRSMDEARAAARVIGWPMIVKPVDNRGAFGVNVAEDETTLRAAYLDALMNAHSRMVLVEAFIEGIHITVDGCVDQDGAHHNLGIATKRVTEGKKPIITEVNYPAEIPNDMRDRVADANSRVVEALGIKGGLTHSEYIVDKPGRCFLVETANRGGGVLTSNVIIPLHSGVDPSELIISTALGEAYRVVPKPYRGCVALKFFVFKPGKLDSIGGVDEALAIPGVHYLRLLVKPGDVLESPRSGAGRHGFAILQAPDQEAIKRLHRDVLGTLRVAYA